MLVEIVMMMQSLTQGGKKRSNKAVKTDPSLKVNREKFGVLYSGHCKQLFLTFFLDPRLGLASSDFTCFMPRLK